MDAVPVDYATPVGTVRGLISDTEQFDFDQNGVERYRMSDGQLESFIALAGGDRLFAASAHALRAQATLEVVTGRVWQSEDLRVDGAKTADALRLLARDYDGRQKELDDELALSDGAFEIIPFGYPYHNLES
jgi:hypothetical protein